MKYFLKSKANSFRESTRIDVHLCLCVAYSLLIVVMFVLPFYSVEGYSILRNTTSHLGAQKTPNALIMNIVFVLLGITCILEAWRYLRDYWVQKILLSIFAIGLILVAFFRHAPIMTDTLYNINEDALHSLFASMIGFSFTLFTITAAFIEKTIARRLLALFLGLSAMGFSYLMFTHQSLAGLWQRLMFMVSFGWLLFFFNDKLVGEEVHYH